MAFGNRIPDATLLRNVERKLLQRCSSGNRISAIVSGGSATISGNISHEHERKPIIRTVSGVQGVRRVIDQLRLVIKVRSDR